MPTLKKRAVGPGMARQYHTHGTVVTATVDVGSDTSYLAPTLTATLPALTAVTATRWRHSPNGSTWSAWVTFGTYPVMPAAMRYVQVEVELTTTNSLVTPTLTGVNLTYPTTGTAEFPLGVFLLSSPKETVDEGENVIRDVEAYDQCVILQRDAADGAYLIPAGTNYISAVSALLTSAGITRQNLVPVNKTLPYDRRWDGGTSKLQIINDLLDAINYYSIWFDGNGYAVASPYVLPSQAPSTYTYASGDDSVILAASPTRDKDTWNVKNKWVFVTTQTDRPLLRSTYTNTNPNSETSTVNTGYTATDYREVDAVDQATLDALVQRAYQDAVNIFETVEWRSLVMPQHEHIDNYTFTYPPLNINGIVYRETSWSIEMSESGTMTHSMRRTVPV